MAFRAERLEGLRAERTLRAGTKMVVEIRLYAADADITGDCRKASLIPVVFLSRIH